MKNSTLFLGILLIILIAGCTGEKKLEFPLSVDKPYVTYAKTSTISIEKMELTDTSTVLSVLVKYRPQQSLRLAGSCKLITDTGIELPIISSEGIKLDSMFIIPDSGEIDFTLTFGAMPEDAKYFDFIECSGDGCWNLYGILFSSEKSKQKLPDEWKNISYDKNETLPSSTFSDDSAVVAGSLLGYRPEMDISLTLYYMPFGQNRKEVSIPVDQNGNFKVSVTPYLPCNGILTMQGQMNNIVLVPGQEAYIMYNLAELSESDYVPDFKGYLASTNHENAKNDSKFNMEKMLEKEALDGKSAADILSYLDGKLKEAYDSINFINAGDAYKKLCKINVESEYLNIRLDYSSFWRNYCYRRANITSQEEYQAFMNNLKLPRATTIDSLRLNIPSLDCVNKPYFSLTDNIFSIYTRYKEYFPAINNSENEEALKAYTLLTKFESGASLSEEEMKEMDSFNNKAYLKLLQERIAERETMKEALMNNKSAHIHELDDVAPDKILNTILENYRGKAVLIDIWATWCGPCKAAHKTILPLKEELKNKDIVFAYVTGPTSPVDKWGEMMPEISGEHYYLTNEQYRAIMNQYESQGVPTYLIFDTKGQFSYKSIGYPGNNTMKTQLLKALEN